MIPPHVIHTRHVLAVQDLNNEGQYYINKLGFERDFTVPGWEFLSLGSFKVMLGECPDALAPAALGDHSYFAHILVQDIDSLFEEFRTRGAEFIGLLENKPWGLREFVVRTPGGHRMVFGQILA